MEVEFAGPDMKHRFGGKLPFNSPLRVSNGVVGREPKLEVEAWLDFDFGEGSWNWRCLLSRSRALTISFNAATWEDNSEVVESLVLIFSTMALLRDVTKTLELAFRCDFIEDRMWACGSSLSFRRTAVWTRVSNPCLISNWLASISWNNNCCLVPGWSLVAILAPIVDYQIVSLGWTHQD
ncbi:hypothetical protein Tco_1391227 [Tanacetum coccineum]